MSDISDMMYEQGFNDGYQKALSELKPRHETIVKAADDMYAELKERRWIPVDKRKPEHHEFVILTGIEAINNKRVYAIKCWDRDTWRPCNSAPSIFWDYWHKLPEPPKMN